MTTFDRGFWEGRWSQVLREHGDQIAQRPPNVHLVAEVGDLRPGRALDAGCGHGSDTLWLAARGWQVTAVDFSATALAHARSTAEAAGADVAERIAWVEGDLGTWTPQPSHYDLVACLYVHVAGSVEEMVRRLAAGVAPGGTLLLVGHRPIDPATGAPTAAADQVQVSVDAAAAALDPGRWELVVAEDRPRATAGTGVDAVIRARHWAEVSRENIELVRRLYGELASEGSPLEFERRLSDEALGRFLDPGIEWLPVEHSLLAVESYRGFDGVRRFWGEFLSAWESYKVELLSFHDAGDQVAVVVHIVGRTHELEVDETRSSLLTLRDGRVVRVESFADPEGAREAAGLP